MKNIAHFISGHPEIVKYQSAPEPMIKQLPEWYRKYPRFSEDAPTVKACMPFFDSFTLGYTITTPCEIMFYVDENGEANYRLPSEGYAPFIGRRVQMPDFPVPPGFSPIPFHWRPEWAISLPDGYSALFVSPLNRFDLPFITTSGVIDSDKMSEVGQYPFFIKEGFEGILPFRTPIVQIIPFKREEWEMTQKILSNEEYEDRVYNATKKYRDIGHSGYKSSDWQRKIFE